MCHCCKIVIQSLTFICSDCHYEDWIFTEVRHLATTLTAGLSFDTLFSLILNFARSLSLVQVDSSGFLHITKYV